MMDGASYPSESSLQLSHGSLSTLLLADANDDVRSPRSWRAPRFTDWELMLGKKKFRVHMTVLAEGPRASTFFYAQFRKRDAGRANSTDLTALLPELCWPIIDSLLDYFYDDVLNLVGENVVLFYKVAHILQIADLAKRSVLFMEGHQTAINVVPMLAHAVLLGPGLDPLVKFCLDVVARNFDAYPANTFVEFPPDILFALLNHPELRATSANLCHCITAYLRLRDDDKNEVDVKEIFSDLLGFLPEVQASDALYLLDQADKHQEEKLRKECMDSVVKNFPFYCGSSLVTLRSNATVCELLDRDELTCSEDFVFKIIQEYIAGKGGTLAKKDLEDIWATCRFVWLSPAAVPMTMERDDIPMRWLKYGLVGQVVLRSCGPRAFDSFVMTQSASDPDGFVKKRLSRRKAHYRFETPFDTNGVIYAIATKGHSLTYKNPHTSEDVRVSFSSVLKGTHEDFVAHKQPHLKACSTGDYHHSWMQVDLGADRSVHPQHYCLRSDQAEGKLRNWMFQASNDGISWTTLRTHLEDRSLSDVPMSEASWAIHSNEMYYRFFRIYNDGVNSSGSHNLACTGIEIYGFLHGRL